MATENYTAKFRVDISDLKKGITEANKEIKKATAEFKNATAGMDDWSKSIDGVNAKIDEQTKKAEAERKKLDLLKQQLQRLNDAEKNGQKIIEQLSAKYEEAAATFGATSEEAQAYAKQLDQAKAAQDRNTTAAEKLKLQIINQDTAVKNCEAQVSKYKDQLKALQDEDARTESETEKLTKTIEDQQTELDQLKQKYQDVVLQQGKNSAEAKALGDDIDALSADLAENRQKLNEAERAADDFDNSLEDTSSGGISVFGVALGNLIANVVENAISKLKDLVTNTIEVGRTFDTSMSKVGALSGATDEDLAMLRDTAKEFGATTQFSASQAADALGYMALAGWDAQQSADGLGGVLNLAAASQMDLAEASDLVTDYLSAFGLEASDSAYFADILAYAQSKSNTTTQALGEAFKNVAANMNAAGQDVETTTALLAMLANQGLKGSEAGTALAATLRDMTAKMKPYNDATELAEMSAEGFASITGDMNDILGRNAIAIGNTLIPISDMNGNYRDMTDILMDVESATNGMGDAEKAAALQTTFTADSIKGLNLLLNAGISEAADFEWQLRSSGITLEGFQQAATESGVPIDEFRQKLEEAGVSSDEFANTLGSTSGDASMFVSEIGKLTDSGQDVYAIMEDLGIGMEDLQKAMDNSSGSAEDMAKKMNDNLGGDLTALGSKFEGVQLAIYEKFEPALREGAKVLDKMLDALSWLVDHGSEVVAVIGGIAAGVGAYVAYTTALTVMTKGWKALTVVTKLQAAAQAALNAVMALNPIGLVVAAIAALVTAFVILWNKSEKFRNFWIDLWKKIKTAAEPVIEAISEWFSEAWDKVKKVWGAVSGWFKDLWQKIVNSFAFKVLVDYFKTAWKNIKVVWDVVVKYFKTLWENIKLIFSAVKSVLSGDFSGAWGAIKKIFGNVGTFFKDTVLDAIKKIFGNIDEFFGGIFTKAFDKIKEIWGNVAQWFSDNVFTPIINFFMPVIEFFTAAWEIIQQLAEGCWELIKVVWGLVKDWFVENVITPLVTFFTELWNTIKAAAETAWTFIKGVWTVVSGWFRDHIITPLTNFFIGLWTTVKNAAKTAWDFIKGVWNAVSGWFKDHIITPVGNAFTTIWDKIKTGAKDAWSGIKSVFGNVADWFKDKFSTAWQKVKDVFSTGGKVFDGIKDGIVSAFTTVVNAIIRGINKVIAIPFDSINDILDTIENISIAGIQPFDGLISRLPVPQIPELAQGGILKRGQVGLLEGNGAEAVVPLEKNTGGLKKIADLILDNMDIPSIDTSKIAEVIVIAVDKIVAAINAIKIPDAVKVILPFEIDPPDDDDDMPSPDRLKQIAQAIASEIHVIVKGQSPPPPPTKEGDTINNYNFNQTNNSPKALSRYEIYRQTKNLINAVKEV